jgi:protein CpxP
MKRENILLAAIVLLALTNGAVLFYFLRQRPNFAPRHDQRIVDALRLDAEQQKEFEKLKADHRRQMNELDRKFNDLLDGYFGTLASNNVSSRDSLEKQLGSIEAMRARVTWQHFGDLKALCRSDQKDDFNAFLPELIKFIVQRGPRNGPPLGPGPHEN